MTPEKKIYLTPRASLKRLKADRRARYLAAGAFNTIVGYLSGLGLYYSLSSKVNIVLISIIINIICISLSFLTYKLFVFQTRGNWLREYFRCYVVYGGAAVFGIAAIWILVDRLHIPFWAAQGGTISATIIISYVGHSRFSFTPNIRK